MGVWEQLSGCIFNVHKGMQLSCTLEPANDPKCLLPETGEGKEKGVITVGVWSRIWHICPSCLLCNWGDRTNGHGGFQVVCQDDSRQEQPAVEHQGNDQMPVQLLAPSFSHHLLERLSLSLSFHHRIGPLKLPADLVAHESRVNWHLCIPLYYQLYAVTVTCMCLVYSLLFLC